MTLEKNLLGKTALITGAGQGVGQGIAFALAERGAKVAVVGRTLSKCESTCEAIRERFGGDAIAVQCDVASREDLERAVTTTVEAFGGIQILVNNAVSTALGPLLSLSSDKVLKAYQVGPMATLNLMQLCYPYLKAEGGSIINLASTAAKRWDMSNYGVYAAEKEGVRALTRAAASEWGADNIRANVILPHATSPALKGWIENNPAEAEAFIASIPMRRIGDCEQDIGKFVALLCSPEASYVSGQSIAVDGGQAYMG
ncbi:SDR family oxidoreductase [Aestuariicella hydrocarbonica]|uniref:SDR family oxidoreductase n=1 Tax=Pseudomaricurvus hydrocarbonicus TaxID=1470433 RepID=A0A9E5JX33_9GAMM|nr:SDR family NAD(P)-dependent oxidoreductase [Aestuariicella hydrocarbonica]NHO66889.1 SDR family oxidoreductase [Aestuariicella hydrocarbonica]